MTAGMIPPRLRFLDAVQRHEDSTPMMLNIACALSSFYNWQKGDCWPSQKAIAVLAKTTPRTVQTEIGKLARAGLVKVVCGKNRRKGNHYKLAFGGRTSAICSAFIGAESLVLEAVNSAATMRSRLRMKIQKKPLSCEARVPLQAKRASLGTL